MARLYFLVVKHTLCHNKRIKSAVGQFYAAAFRNQCPLADVTIMKIEH